MVGDLYNNMKGYSRGPRSRTSLHNSQPAEVQNSPEDDLWYFPPIRERDSAPPVHRPSQTQR